MTEEFESPDMRAARARGLCGNRMANDTRRKSGCICGLEANHPGRCASQFSKAALKVGQALRNRRS